MFKLFLIILMTIMLLLSLWLIYSLEKLKLNLSMKLICYLGFVLINGMLFTYALSEKPIFMMVVYNSIVSSLFILPNIFTKKS